MKKILLTIAAGIACLSASAAEPTVVDFSTAESFEGAENTKVTVNGIDFTFLTANAYINSGYNGGANYVMLKFAKPAGAFSFSLPFDCSKIVVTTTPSPSTSLDNKVTLYAGEATVLEQSINGKNADFTFALGEYTAAGTVYKFEATGSKNSQMAKLTLYPVSADPSITIDDKSLSFATAKEGTQTIAFRINAENITSDLSVASDNAAFKVAPTVSVETATTTGIEVSFNGTSTETVNGNITVSAGSASATIPVEGFAVAHAGTESDPLTVSDVLKMNNLNNSKFYVTGTIGNLCAGNAKDGMVTEIADAANNVKSNIILKEGEKMIGVALPAGETRDKLNIVDNADNAGKTIIVTGTLENYFSAPGLKGTEYISGLDSTGIADVAVDADAPVEYYNLQGVRMQGDMAPGLYIRRQGNQATKVLVK